MASAPRWALCRLPLACAVACVLAPAVLQAQTVRGGLRLAGTGEPLARAFVILRDSAGTEITRTLTDPMGRFTLQAGAAGRYQIQTAIIGWRRWFSPLFLLREGETLEFEGEVAYQPVNLSAIVVRGERRCQTSPDSGQLVARVWDEARKALAAVSWTQRSVPLTYELERYDRRLDTTLNIQEEHSRTWSAQARGSPFTSLAAERLSQDGYIVRDTSGDWEHYGPDADVLLSRAFANDHCFFLTEHGENEQLVGLGFEPVRGRSRPDIAGVLWLDRESAELASLEFRYRNLPWEVNSSHLGGHAEFVQVENGGWIVRSWWVRMPELTVRTDQLRWEGGARYSIAAFWQAGGHVIRIRMPDGTKLELTAPTANRTVEAPPPPRVRGIVTDLNGAPLEGAIVHLRTPAGETHGVALSDDAGAFELTAPGAGRYQLHARHIGHSPTNSAPLDLEEGTVVSVEVGIRPLAVELDPVTVEAAAPSREMREFYRRRQSGMTLYSFDRADIDQLGARVITEVLTQVPSARIVGPMPSEAEVHLNSAACPAVVYIDRHPAWAEFFANPLPLDWIEAIEVFRTPAETPAEFRHPNQRRTRCGTIVIWTIGSR